MATGREIAEFLVQENQRSRQRGRSRTVKTGVSYMPTGRYVGYGPGQFKRPESVLGTHEWYILDHAYHEQLAHEYIMIEGKLQDEQWRATVAESIIIQRDTELDRFKNNKVVMWWLKLTDRRF